MKKEFLKIAGVKSEKDFYKKYPTEEAFFKAHPKAIKQLAKGGEAFPQTATMDNFFSYGVPVPPTYYAHGGAFPMAQPEAMFFSPGYGTVYNPYNKAMGGNTETYPQAIPYGNLGTSKAFYFMQEGGQQDPREVLMQIAEALQQGTPPEQVLKYLVDNGVPQEKAVEIIQNVMSKLEGAEQQIQSQGAPAQQEAAMQDPSMQGQPMEEQPMMEDGGNTDVPDASRQRIAEFTGKVNNMAKTANEKRLASVGNQMFKKGGAKELKRFDNGSQFNSVNDLINYVTNAKDPNKPETYSDAGSQTATNSSNYLTREDLINVLGQYFGQPNYGQAPMGDMSMFAPMLANMFTQNQGQSPYMFTGPSSPLYKFTASMDGQKLRNMYGNKHIYEALFPESMYNDILSGKFEDLRANNPEFRSIADTYGLTGMTHRRKGFFPRLFGNKEEIIYDFRVPNEAPTVNVDPSVIAQSSSTPPETLSTKPVSRIPSPYVRPTVSNTSGIVPTIPSSSTTTSSNPVPFSPPSIPQSYPAPVTIDPNMGSTPSTYTGPTVVDPSTIPAVTQPAVTQPASNQPSSYNPPAFDLDYSLKNIISPLEQKYGRGVMGDITGNVTDWRNYKPAGMGPNYTPDKINDRWNETMANTAASNRSDKTQGEIHKINMESVKNLPAPIQEIAADTSMNKDLDMRVLLMAAAGANTALGDLTDFRNRKNYYYDPEKGTGATSDQVGQAFNSPEVQQLIMQQYNDDPERFTESILAYRDMFDQRLNQMNGKPGTNYSTWHNRNVGLGDYISGRYFGPSSGYVDPYNQPYDPMMDLYNNPNWRKYGGTSKGLRRYDPGGPVLGPNVPPVNDGQVIEVPDPIEPIPTWQSPNTPIADQLNPNAIGYKTLGMDEPITMDLQGEKPNYGYKDVKVGEKPARFVGEDKYYRNQVVKNQLTNFLNKDSIQSKFFGMSDPLEQYYASLDTSATPVARGDFNVLSKDNIPNPYNRNPVRQDYSPAPSKKMGGSIKQNDIMYMDENMIKEFVARGGQIEYLD